MKTNVTTIVVCILTLIKSGAALAQTEVPHTFQAGQPARAAEVNENFDVLESATDTNAESIDENATAIQNNLEAISNLPIEETIVVDFTDPGACVFDQPGRYEVNRSWEWYAGESLCSARTREEELAIILVTADDVSIDLNGFELGSDWIDDYQILIQATGARFKIRNGKLWTASGPNEPTMALHISGTDFVIDNISAPGFISTSSGNGLVNNVWAGSGISLGLDSTLQNSEIVCALTTCIYSSSGTVIRSNRIRVSGGGGIQICSEQTNVTIINNIIKGSIIEEAIHVCGDMNVIKGNIAETTYPGEGVAILVTGTGNIIDSNIILPGYLTGISFQQDGNYYGSNRVSAMTPFDLQGTLQTDWGGNVSY